MIQNLITVYLAGLVATIALAAIRTPDSEVRPTAIIAAIWPVVLPLVLLNLILSTLDWELDIDTVNKPLGWRKPTNPEVTGFAVTVLWLEFRVFKARVKNG